MSVKELLELVMCSCAVDLRRVPLFSIASGLPHMDFLTWLEGVWDYKKAYLWLRFCPQASMPQL